MCTYSKSIKPVKKHQIRNTHHLHFICVHKWFVVAWCDGKDDDQSVLTGPQKDLFNKPKPLFA